MYYPPTSRTKERAIESVIMDEKLMDQKEQNKEIKKTLDGLIKDLGVSVVNFDGGSKLQVEAQPTGSISLDLALGIGGLPRGRVVELYGLESHGKSTIALMAIATLQKAGGVALYIDAENAMGPEWAEKLGVDLDPMKCPMIQENCAEKVFDIVDKAVVSNKFDMIVVDSVTALSPLQEIEGTMEQQTIGLQARIISKGLRKLIGKIGRSRTTVVFINQMREKIGVMFGDPMTTPGGKALKFYSSVRMRVSKSSKEILDENKTKTGHEITVKLEKNKVGPPYTEATLTLLYEKGIDSIGEIFDVAMVKGVLTRFGPTYTYGEKKWKGQEAVKAEIRANQAFADELIEAIKKAPARVVAVGVAGEEDEPEEMPD